MTTPKFFLAPNARWQGRNLTGQPIIGGKLYTYVNGTDTPKATYQDREGLIPNTNPVILDGKGEANIYWKNDDLYTIVLKTAQDQVVYSQDAYPSVAFDSSDTPTVLIAENLARNPQFTWWNNSTSFSPIQNAENRYDYICDDWIIYRSNSNSTINVTRGTFTADQVTVPGTPIYYLHYECTSAGAGGETYRRMSQYYTGVRTLAGKQVSVSFWAKSSSSSTLGLTLRQYFGSGGSSDVSTVAISPQALTSAWAQYTGTVTLPTTVGKTIGSQDALVLDLDFAPNSVGDIDICNIQLQLGSAVTQFPYVTVDDQFKRLDKTVNQSIVPTGSFMPTISTIAPPGWLVMDDKTIGNSNSGASNVGMRFKALFEMLWNEIGSDLWTPIYTSAGAVTTFGASAEADWNSNKRMSLTKMLGRALVGAGTSITPRVFTASNGSSNLQLNVTDVASLFTTGTPFQVSSTGTLPTGLAAATTYYAITTGSGSAIYVATSLANALAGTAITWTNAGTGVHTLTLNASARVNGQYIGQENKSLVGTENGPHIHTATTLVSAAQVGSTKAAEVGDDIDTIQNAGVGDPYNTSAPTASTTVNTSGSGTPFSLFQPTSFVNVMIKL